MDYDQVTEILGGWEGYELESGRRIDSGSEVQSGQVELKLMLDGGCGGACSGCGRPAEAVHEYTWRRIRDLPILDCRTYITFQRRRFACSRCGARLERLSWIQRYARVTNRLAESVARLCSVLPIKHVAQHYDLGWDTVKEIDKAWLKRRLSPVDFTGVSVIVMDEFAIQKGHRYATVVADAQTKRVLWVGRGRSRKDVRPFFMLLRRPISA